MQCSPNPPRTKVYVLGLPCVGRLSVGGLARAPDVAGARYPPFDPVHRPWPPSSICYRALRFFLSSPPPARASVSSATQSDHCPPTNRTHRRPAVPPPPNRPALLAFPPPLPTERTCEHKAEHAGPPTEESLPEPVSRRYPDEAERVHVVLSRERGLPVSVLALSRDRDPGFYQSSDVDWGSQ